MEYNVKSEVVKQAIIVMITDPEVDNSIYMNSDTNKSVVIDYALHFSEMFYKNEVGNMVEFFDKMYNKEISRKYYSLSESKKKDHYTFIDNFIKTYSKKETSDNLSFEEKKIILQETICKLKNHFEILKNTMVENLFYDKNELDKIYKNYLQIIENIEAKFFESRNISTLLNYIKKAKMNYVLKLNEKNTIYPFVYDMLLISFLIEIRLVNKSKSYVDTQDLFRTLKQVRKNASHPAEDKRYMDIEYLKLAEILIQVKPNELQNYLLYHYSEILNSDYNNILSVFKQLRHKVTDHHKHEYKYKDFSFVTNVASKDFRYYSLYIL